MKELEKKIRESYINYILEHKKRPQSIASFMGNLDQNIDSDPEATFYKFYNSFSEIDKLAWKEFFDITINSIQSEEEYMSFPVMDKLQVFYYTLFNVIKDYRDYVTFIFEDAAFWEFTPNALSLFHENFKFFTQDLVNEGVESGEIASRPFVTDYYGGLIWGQTLLILKTWISDTSEEYDRSDAAVEKSTTFAFDIMGRGLFDSGFDLVKFLFSKTKQEKATTEEPKD